MLELISMVIMIAAINRLGVIGNENSIPWHCPADLAHFNKATKDRAVIIGRKTYDSLVQVFGGPHILPGRTVIVVSRTGVDNEHVACFDNIRDALIHADSIPGPTIIAGGAEIYRQCMPITDKIYLSVLPNSNAGDTKMPDWNRQFAMSNHVIREGFKLQFWDRKKAKGELVEIEPEVLEEENDLDSETDSAGDLGAPADDGAGDVTTGRGTDETDDDNRSGFSRLSSWDTKRSPGSDTGSDNDSSGTVSVDVSE